MSVIPHRPPVPEEQMSWRAQAYLTVAAAHHIVVAVALTFWPDSFDSPAFVAIFKNVPLPGWAAIMAFAGVALAWSAIGGREILARFALILSATIALMWAVAFFLVIVDGAASVFSFSYLTAFALKDFIVCAQTLRSPFEPLVRLYTDPRDR